MKKLILISLIFNTLAANAWSADNQRMQQQASAREMDLRRQAQAALQAGKTQYNYNTPGYYQLQQQANGQSDLQRQLQNQDLQAEESARSSRLRQEEQANLGF